MKFFRRFLIITILLLIFIYVCNITLMPNNIILLQGERLDVKAIFGVSIYEKIYGDGQTLQASSNINKNSVDKVGKIDLRLNLFGRIPVKDMTVNVIPNTKVIPLGKAIGMKLYTDGVLVVGKTEINGKKPYEKTDIQEGDMIVQINDEDITSTKNLMKVVNKSKGKTLKIKYKREEDHQ